MMLPFTLCWSLVLIAIIVAAAAASSAAWPITSAHASSSSSDYGGPYPISNGWTYYFEAVRSEPWPRCQLRFLSFDNPGCNAVNLWSAASDNQMFLVQSLDGSDRTKTKGFFSSLRYGQAPRNFSIHAVGCGGSASVVSYSTADCADTKLSLGTGHAPNATTSSRFSFRAVNFSEYEIVAVDRLHCASASNSGDDDGTLLGFATGPGSCTTPLPGPGKAFVAPNNKAAADAPLRWRLTPAAPPVQRDVRAAVDGGCADPFVWWQQNSNNNNNNDGKLIISCTGGKIPISTSPPPLEHTSHFSRIDSALGGPFAPWCSAHNRWAPEVTCGGADSNNSNTTKSGSSSDCIMVVCDLQPDGAHRTGIALSSRGSIIPGAFDKYSPTYLTLSPGPAGDIDPHIFFDPVSKMHFLIWKSEDNRIHLNTTHIWAQQVSIDFAAIGANNASTKSVFRQIGPPRVIMDSASGHLWWIESFGPVGWSLVEAPEMFFDEPTGYYFLFFAASRYVDASYAEGVARSRNFWGPYEKCAVPLISTGSVGYNAQGKKLQGPGHAGFYFNATSRTMHAAFAAHTATTGRTVYLTEIALSNGENDEANYFGWPVAKLQGHF